MTDLPPKPRESMTDAEWRAICAKAKQAVADAPPFTDDQVAALRTLLRPMSTDLEETARG